MIDTSIKEFLLNQNARINLVKLIEFMESTGIEFSDKILLGPSGMTTYERIYLNMDRLRKTHIKKVVYIILHEIGHFKRIVKFGGKDVVIAKLSYDDFNKFFDDIINEEVIADRYACFTYQILMDETYPREATQRLDLMCNKAQYVHTARLIFGVIKNKEENYKALFESFIEK